MSRGSVLLGSQSLRSISVAPGSSIASSSAALSRAVHASPSQCPSQELRCPGSTPAAATAVALARSFANLTSATLSSSEQASQPDYGSTRRHRPTSRPSTSVLALINPSLQSTASSRTSKRQTLTLRHRCPTSRGLHTTRHLSRERPSSSSTSSDPAVAPASTEQGKETTRRTQDEETATDEAEKRENGVIPKPPKDISIGEIKRLFTLARPEKKTLGIALGLLTISSAVSLSVPFTLGRIIDLFTAPETSSLPVSVPTAAVLLATVFALGAAANTGRSILMRIAGQRIVKRLRTDAYENTLKLDMAKFDVMGSSLTPGTTTGAGAGTAGLSDTTTTGKLEGSEKTGAAHQTTSPSTSPSKEQRSADQVGTVKKEDVSDAKASGKRSSLTSALSLSSTSETTSDVGVRGVGDIISRLGSDSSIVGESLTRELSEGLRALATVVVGVGMMIYISAKLTVLMLCIVPPSAIGAVVYGRYLKKLSRRTQKKVGEMIAIAEERLSSIRTVQSFNAVNPVETTRFAKKANDILDLAKKEAYASGLFYGGAGFSGNITMLALLSYGGKLVSQGEITVGDLSSLMLYTAYVGSSLVSLTSFFSTIMKGLGAAARVFELLDAKPAKVNLSVGKALLPSTPAMPLTFSNVHFSYPTRPKSPILRGVNCTIEKGKSVAIAGTSGSGKSTLANLIIRFYDPESGVIKYGDEDIRGFTPESWRDRVSMVPQDPALFNQTIAENIAYGKPDATMSEIREAARLANCLQFIEELPQGFDTPVGAKAAQLSGGQRQRLAIARALVRQPSILILDEATSALDAASETLVNEAVKKITSTNSLTTILIAHRLSTLKTANEIIFMKDGKICERGTYEELARDGTQFFDMIRTQMLGTGVVSDKASKEGESSHLDDEAMENEAKKPSV